MPGQPPGSNAAKPVASLGPDMPECRAEPIREGRTMEGITITLTKQAALDTLWALSEAAAKADKQTAKRIDEITNRLAILTNHF